MRAAARFFAASLCLGIVSAWASENMFWSAPSDSFSYRELPLLWVVYGLCAACALAAVLLTGLTGWRGVFLGGALLGFLVEGAIAGTMFEAFPFQLVWTPLAWHALITGVCVFGLSRKAGVWPISRLACGWLALGLFGSLFAAYWPVERAAMPDIGATAVYLLGVGLSVPIASIVLDRLAPIEMPPPWALSLPVVILAGCWLFKMVAVPSPVLLALPALLFATFAAMKRLGAGAGPLDVKPAGQPWRHWLFLITPAVMSILAPLSWTAFGGVYTNIPVALATCLVSLAGFAYLLFTAARFEKGSAR